MRPARAAANREWLATGYRPREGAPPPITPPEPNRYNSATTAKRPGNVHAGVDRAGALQTLSAGPSALVLSAGCSAS